MAGHHTKALHKKDMLLELNYPDSMYDQRLFLLKDGRKRGLWIFLEEEPKDRIESDARQFDRGFKEFVEYLKKKKLDFDKPADMFDLVMTMKMHFDYFFSHRTEATATRLSWKQVKKLAAALNAGHKAEKRKTDVDD